MLGLCACVCLSVLVATVSAQNPIYRPEVAAGPVEDGVMAAIIAECNRRIAINDTISHYVRVPSDCSAYAACEHPETGVVPALMLCPAGMFFDDDMDVLTCVPAGQVECVSEGNPCVGRPDGYNQDVHRTQTVQGAYYRCQGGRTMGGGWCELGEQYLKFDVPCFRIPDLPPQTPPPRAEIPCTLGAVASDRKMYMLGNIPMPCAPGTVYDAVQCGCVFDLGGAN